jgi:hypothetical protein
MIALPKPKNVSPLGHSADVDLKLHLGDRVVALAQTSRSEIILAEDADVPVGPARVESIVDGESYCCDVTITGRRPGTLVINISR